MQRMRPITQGVWESIGHRHYQHVAGIEVRERGCGWEIIGGPRDGALYSRLWAAQAAATSHYRKERA